jgi:integrase
VESASPETSGPAITPARKTPKAQKKMRGFGRVYLPTYRDKKTGAVKTSSVYWMQWSVGGKTYRDSTQKTRHGEAVEELKKKLAAIGRGHLVGPEQKRVTVSNIAEEYLRDYEVRGLRSLDTARGRVAHLQDFFGKDQKAMAITTDRIRAYQLHRKQDGAEAATINRETSALARMFTLAMKAGKLSWRPPFPDRLEEKHARQGFFEIDDYRAIRAHLAPAYQDVLDFAYFSGWRRSEITGLTWAEVDLPGGLIRLSPERSKSKEGRRLPLSPPLREVLGRRLAARRLDVPLVFHHHDGHRIGDFRKAWATACVKAGLSRVAVGTSGTEKKAPAKLFHDLRRTVARNLVRSGTPEGIAMKLTGHKTRSVFERYNITSEEDLRRASLRLAEYVSAQPVTPAGLKAVSSSKEVAK